MMKKILLLVFIVALFNFASVEAGHVSCGDTIYTDTVLDSDLLNCPWHGIIIGASNITLDCNGHTIRGISTGPQYGIYMPGKQNVEVRNCNVFLFYRGIVVDGSSNNTLTNNTASNNSYGIWLWESSNNTLTDNTASNTYYGIYLSSSSNNNVLTDNTANSNNYNGIYLLSSSSNILTNNTANSNDVGIRLDYSLNNLIYNNYFNNTINAFDDAGANFWNINKTKGTNIVGGPLIGGNFWSDYNGSDLNGDGIGDTNLPYNSNGNIQNGGDFLPLVVPVISGRI